MSLSAALSALDDSVDIIYWNSFFCDVLLKEQFMCCNSFKVWKGSRSLSQMSRLFKPQLPQQQLCSILSSLPYAVHWLTLWRQPPLKCEGPYSLWQTKVSLQCHQITSPLPISGPLWPLFHPIDSTEKLRWARLAAWRSKLSSFIYPYTGRQNNTRPSCTGTNSCHLEEGASELGWGKVGKGGTSSQHTLSHTLTHTRHNQYIICTFLSVVELLQCCHGDVIFSSRGAVILCFKLHCNVGGGWKERRHLTVLW